MLPVWITCILFCCLADASAQKESAVPFSWLTGRWEMIRGAKMIRETWVQVTPQRWEANSIMLEEGKPDRMLESVWLEKVQDTWQYRPLVDGQNQGLRVSFSLISLEDSGFVARNQEHDFPKRISYRRHADTLRAIIDDGLNPPLRQSVYQFILNKK